MCSRNLGSTCSYIHQMVEIHTHLLLMDTLEYGPDTRLESYTKHSFGVFLSTIITQYRMKFLINNSTAWRSIFSVFFILCKSQKVKTVKLELQCSHMFLILCSFLITINVLWCRSITQHEYNYRENKRPIKWIVSFRRNLSILKRFNYNDFVFNWS